MKISDSCAKCLYDKQAIRVQNQSDSKSYLEEVQKLIDMRNDQETAPYKIYQFNGIFEKYYGKQSSYAKIKKESNQFVLNIEDTIRQKIESSQDPLFTSLFMARAGNYIDFGAMSDVDHNEFLKLLDNSTVSKQDQLVYQSLISQLSKASTFLLIADNAGEIVLDKLFLEQLKKLYPQLSVSILVRGEEVLNDATTEDACESGIDQYGKIISNGNSAAGTIIELLSKEALDCLNTSDVILSKGQGNYESLSGSPYHIFYLFLCKCEFFMEKFQVPKFTGMFIEE